jgi:hypothetical protein
VGCAEVGTSVMGDAHPTLLKVNFVTSYGLTVISSLPHPPWVFLQVFIPQGVKVLCFDTLLQVFILKGLRLRGFAPPSCSISDQTKAAELDKKYST